MRRLRSQVLGRAPRAAARPASFPVEAENLLVGLAPADDAAVYRLDDERALIFTLDFFPPRRRRRRRLRCDRGDERAQRRLRDGRHAAARAVDRGVPEELPIEMLAAHPRRRRRSRSALRARCSRAGTRSATPSRSTASPSSAPFIRTAIWPQERRAGRGRALPDQAARNRADHERPQERARPARSRSSARPAGCAR